MSLKSKTPSFRLSPLRISCRRSIAPRNFEAPASQHVRLIIPPSLFLFLAALKLKLGARTFKSNLVAAPILRKRERDGEEREDGRVIMALRSH